MFSDGNKSAFQASDNERDGERKRERKVLSTNPTTAEFLLTKYGATSSKPQQHG